MSNRRLNVSLFLAMLFLGFGIGPVASAPADDAPASVTIVYQLGLSYANLIVMREQGVLEKQFPKTQFSWRVLASGAAVRDGIVAGQIQIGAGGTAPFLVGWDRGVGYRLIGSLNEINLWLVSNNPKLKTLKDFEPTTKIGLPAPDSIQAIILRKAAQEQLGNAHALDNNLVAIAHPLGLAALQNGQLDAHFANPPFQEQEVQRGGHILLKSYDVFGRSTLNSVFTTEAFAKEHPNFTKTFYRDLEDATKFCREKPDQTAEILSKDSGGKESASSFKKLLTAPDVTFTIVPHGFMKYAKFMKEIGLIEKVPSSMREIELPPLNGAGD